VATVGVDDNQSHALALISAIVKQATCPVTADIESDDDSFLKKAARRGIFALRQARRATGMEHAIDIVLSRYAEFNRLHGCAAHQHDHRTGEGHPHGTPRDHRWQDRRPGWCPPS